ncbi:gem-associated protein 2 [Chironomus tepperi]|uniref:gem-associated protein 2 n=1 Tax=Chironomus tepperi TaxID=113505 RepID=UPI00391FC5B6
MSQRQCLPVEDDDSDVDSEINFNLAQISAHKYLKSVRLEREQIKEIVSAEIPESCIIQNEPVQISNKRQFQSKEWQEHQKDLFENIRSKICIIRNKNIEDRVLKELPMNIEEEIECIKYCRENEPLLSIILTMDSYRQIENFVEMLADYFFENVEDLKLKNLNDVCDELVWIGKWAYALLACLRIPLGPEVHNSIRMIAKACLNILDHFKTQSNLPYDSKQFIHLNLLVTIIANNFHQYDLLSL